jgi:hypothetical protein
MTNDQIRRANARLIAASPELADALEALVLSADCDHHSEPDDAHVVVQRDGIERARAALKAAGRGGE